MLTQTDLLKKYQLPIRGHLGQHLLIDPNIQKKIIEALEPTPQDFILEIGPGLGALTQRLLSAGCQVWAVEKDERFIQVLEGEYSQDYAEQFYLIHKDVLKMDFEKVLKKGRKGYWKVISNLPYYITAPILFSLLRHRDYFSKAILMMQKEVASRLKAVPGTKDYGRLTLGVRYASDVRHLFDVGRTCFTPQPEVASSVVELTFHTKSASLKPFDEDLFYRIVEVAFSQRRKIFFNLLIQASDLPFSREEYSKVFEILGFNPKARGEQLLLKDYLLLTQKLVELRDKKPLLED